MGDVQRRIGRQIQINQALGRTVIVAGRPPRSAACAQGPAEGGTESGCRGAANPAPKSKTLLCAAWACSDVGAAFGAVLLAEPEGPPALSAAGGVMGGSRTALWPAGRCTGDSPGAGAPQLWRQLLTAAPDAAAARAAEANVPQAKACGGPEQDTATAWSTPLIGAAGSTAGKEGAGVAALPGAVAAAGAASDWPPPLEAGPASTPKQASAYSGVNLGSSSPSLITPQKCGWTPGNGTSSWVCLDHFPVPLPIF